jgi:hypothetical protein
VTGVTGLVLAATVAVAFAGPGGAAAEPSADRPSVGSTGAARPGGRIVFQRIDPDTGKFRLYTVRPDGSGLRAITQPDTGERNDELADWSPDGRSIAYTRFLGVRSDLMVVRRDGTGVRNLTRAGRTGDCLSSEYPSWSPDGRRIAFERALGPAPNAGPPPIVGIFVMDADGSHVRQLTQLEPNSRERRTSTACSGVRAAAVGRSHPRGRRSVIGVEHFPARGRGGDVALSPSPPSSFGRERGRGASRRATTVQPGLSFFAAAGGRRATRPCRAPGHTAWAVATVARALERAKVAALSQGLRASTPESGPFRTLNWTPSGLLPAVVDGSGRSGL